MIFTDQWLPWSELTILPPGGRIYGKLGVTARVEAIAEAQRRGILDRR